MRFATQAEAMAAAASKYNPANMHVFYKDLLEMPVAFNNIANALKIITKKAGEQFPLHPAIVEIIATCYQAQQRVGKLLGDAGAQMGRVHADDLKRHEQPRKNEKLWNV